jgi:membrane protease YdiL (CAAX protease family)
MKGFWRTILYNHADQIRSGWKIGLVLGGYLASQILLGILITILGYSGIFESQKMEIPIFIVDSIIFVIAILLVLRLLDKKQLKDIGMSGLKGNWRNLLFGFLFGAVSIAVIFAILMVTGRVAVQNGWGSPDLPVSMFSGLVLFIFAGVREELFSRGYCIFAFMQMKRLWLSILLSSMVFALLHGLNPNVNVIGLINIVLVGFLLSFMYVKTGNLWMPIGYHIAWNYFQGNIFGLPVSGKVVTALYNIQILRKDLLSGGLFGPEGGVLATIIVLIGFGAVWFYTIRQEKKRL